MFGIYEGSVSNFHVAAKPFLDPQFDIFEWHTHFQSCVRYFLDHAQYNAPVQSLAAFMNIRLPFQKSQNPALSSRPMGSPSPGPGATAQSSHAAGKMPMGQGQQPAQMTPITFVTLLPYVRRLVATGFDAPAVLHGFFGDDWVQGIGPLYEQERRNFLFAAKSDTWVQVKMSYDMDDDQIVPFLRPMQNVSEKEIVTAETRWSEWLALQDWMLGPRAPEGGGDAAASAPGGEARRRDQVFIKSEES